MSGYFNEENTVEQMVLDTVCSGMPPNMVAEVQQICPQMTQISADEKSKNNLRESAKSADSSSVSWRFIPAGDLPRQHYDVLVESMVRDDLVRLNPEIKAEEKGTLPFNASSATLLRRNVEKVCPVGLRSLLSDWKRSRGWILQYRSVERTKRKKA